MPAAALLAILLEVASAAAGSLTPRYAVPPSKLVRKLSHQHRGGDWLLVTTDAERLEVRARRMDAQGLHGLKGRDPNLPPPRDLEWGRIARIDVVTTKKTLGWYAGGLLGGLGAASIARGGAGGGSAWMWGVLTGGFCGEYLGSRHTGAREFYVASVLPAPAPVLSDAPPPADAASQAADPMKSVTASPEAEPARLDLNAAPVSAPVVSAVRSEFGVGISGLTAIGGFAKVSQPCVGGDAALTVVRSPSNLGVRVAGGLHLLRGYSIPTGEVIFTASGTQPGSFEAKQSLWWWAIGPVWIRSQWGGRFSAYAMGGRGIAKASSGQAWANTQGTDPGTTGVVITRAGASWAASGAPLDFGVELLVGGRAAFWDNPPAITDSSGNHVLQGRSATISGVVLRVGYTFGR